MRSKKMIDAVVCCALTAAVAIASAIQCNADDSTFKMVLEPKPTATVETTETEAVYNVPLDHELQLFIIQLCEEHHIDPAIVIAMIDSESDFDSNAIGDSGAAFGLMQVQPKWHRERMDRLGVTDLLDPYENVAVGVDYLAELIAMDKGVEWALMCYNGGFPYANENSRLGIISDYASEVLGSIEKLTEGMIQIVYP